MAIQKKTNNGTSIMPAPVKPMPKQKAAAIKWIKDHPVEAHSVIDALKEQIAGLEYKRDTYQKLCAERHKVIEVLRKRPEPERFQEMANRVDELAAEVVERRYEIEKLKEDLATLRRQKYSLEGQANRYKHEMDGALKVISVLNPRD